MRIIRSPDPGPFAKYGAYKPHLQCVFRNRCAYCRSHEDFMGRIEAMEVDHFQPQKQFEHLKHAWTNLYYCCRRCNHWKSNNWPTSEEQTHGQRFVDPCEEDPDGHFRLTRDARGNQDGKIASETAAGRYSIDKIRLNRPQLIDIRRDIAREERAARKQLNLIDGLMSSLGALAQSSSDIAVLEELHERASNSLEDVQALRPFPLADEAL